MIYPLLIKKLYEVNLFGGVKLGLENCRNLDALCGFPSKQFKSIHVAGTNGKGSVTTKIAKSLELEGYRVGLYTSPHISCFRERIRINGEMIPETAVEFYLSQLFNLAEEEKIPATFFEFTTMLAFLYFAEQKVDYAILETGLGGRLDATNIVHPQLSIMTSIAFDHTEILGKTLEEITLEKAGIIKPGVPVLIGPHVPYPLIKEVADTHTSQLTQVQGDFPTFEDENQAIAKKALELLGFKANDGLQALPPCRMETLQYQGRTVVLDVGHNPDGLTRLFAALEKKYPGSKFRIVFGLSKTKDIPGCLAILKTKGHDFHLVEAPNGRGIQAHELQKLMNLPHKTTVHSTIYEAIHKALTHNDIIVICGSFFIMADARECLSISEARDSIDMNEKFSLR